MNSLCRLNRFKIPQPASDSFKLKLKCLHNVFINKIIVYSSEDSPNIKYYNIKNIDMIKRICKFPKVKVDS